MLRSTIIVLSCLISGCCALFPCHYGTRISGVVVSASGAPIEGAVVRLYGTEKKSATNGCFVFNLASALPFELEAKAPGYKVYKGEVKFGFYSVTVTLVPDGSVNSSTATWREISEQEFKNGGKCT